MTTFLAQTLIDQGYTGATGTTPYKPSTTEQVDVLRSIHDQSYEGLVSGAPAPTATHININFDGTQNNGAFTADGESPTNVWQLSKLQRDATGDLNTIYQPGIGAQTLPSGTLDANGNPAPGSSPSNWESIPWKAGEIGNAILENAYSQLTERVSAVLLENPNAEIALNLAGFSRGSAEAVAFANLLNERGIPGLYEAGAVPINSMVLYDPVNQTGGRLNTEWPSNVQNTLVLVALDEGRAIMSAMPVGANAIVVGVPGAHADVGGGLNAEGVSAVTLKTMRDFLEASGVPVAEIPPELSPDWQQMFIHNSGLDNFGNVKWEFSEGNRFYEGGGLGSIAVQDMLGSGLRLDPVYETTQGTRTFVALRKTVTNESIDTETGERTISRDVITYAKDGVTIKARTFDSVSTDASGQMTSGLNVTYAADGSSILSTALTERQADNSLLTTVRDGLGTTKSTTSLQTFDDGSTLSTTRYPGGRVELLATDETGAPSSLQITNPAGNNTEQIDQFLYVDGSPVLQSRRVVETLYDENGQSRIETVTSYVDGVPNTVRNSYGTDGSLLRSEAVAPPSLANLTERQAITVLNDVAGLIGAIQGGRPLPILQSGLHVLNDLVNPANPAGPSVLFPTLNLATGVVDGLSSLYNLSNALQHGDTLTQISATLNTLNFVNRSLPALLGSGTVLNASLNTFLNGSGTVFNAAADGLIAGGNFNGLVAGGVKERRSLAEADGTAIDHSNSRYEVNSASGTNDGGYGLISTQTLEVEGETNGLNEDGTPGAYNPNMQGRPITITISAAQLLGNVGVTMWATNDMNWRRVA